MNAIYIACSLITLAYFNVSSTKYKCLKIW